MGVEMLIPPGSGGLPCSHRIRSHPQRPGRYRLSTVRRSPSAHSVCSFLRCTGEARRIRLSRRSHAGMASSRFARRVPLCWSKSQRRTAVVTLIAAGSTSLACIHCTRLRCSDSGTCLSHTARTCPVPPCLRMCPGCTGRAPRYRGRRSSPQGRRYTCDQRQPTGHSRAHGQQH